MNYNSICIILAGGKGSRLDGKGKLNQNFNNKTLLEQVYNKVKYQFSYVAVNVNNAKRNTKLNIETVYDKFSDNIGPLAGIHAALCQGNKKLGKDGYVCIVPVDTPFLPKDLRKRLHNNIFKNRSEVVFARSGNRVHPTVGLWKNNIKTKLELSINKGVRKIDKFTSCLKVSYEDWIINKIDPFYNINNHEDLNKAKKMTIFLE